MSSLGNSLYSARKSKGLTQEEVAEKLGVSRQTISKWELDETLPDIRQAKSLAQLYRTTLDDLLQYDAQVEEIQRVIRHTSEETQQKVDWTKLWGEMYPVLTTYPPAGGHPPLHRAPGGAAPGFGIHLPLHALGRLFGAQGHSGQDVDRAAKVQLKGAGEGMAQKRQKLSQP